MAKGEQVKLNLSMSAKTANILDQMADAEGETKADVIRKALTLLVAARAHEKQNHKTAFIDSNNKVVAEVVGL